jgi:hypothetical protein
MATDFNKTLLGYKSCFKTISLMMSREIVLEMFNVHHLIACYIW